MDLVNSPAWALHVNELLQQLHTPGLAVAVIQNDSIASNGFGLATLDPPTNVTADTLFDIASSSKSLTAASVGLLVVDDAKYPDLQWDTPMSSLLPEDFVMSGEGYTEQVTVEDILSHRSGIPGHDYSYFDSKAEQSDTPQSITRNLRNLANAAPPRQKYLYSNIMYIVASWLVEQMSGLAFADFLHQKFFEPLGMNSTHLQPDAAIDAGLCRRFAQPYVWDEETESLRAISLMQAPEAQGCGSIFTSANDYIKWVQALMNKEPPISKELYEGLTRPRIRVEPDDDEDPDTPVSWYAAGLAILDVGGFKFFGHSGLVSGFHSMHFFIPELKFGAVILGNAGDDNVRDNSPANKIAIELIEEVLESAGHGSMKDSKQQRSLVSSISAKKENGDLKQRLCPGEADAPTKDIVFQAYTGRYCNVGYRCMNVEVKANALFVDAGDRSEAFTLRFEHACHGTKFVAHFSDAWEGGDDEVPAEFKLSDRKAVRMGIELEDDLGGYIWFDRVPGQGSAEQVVMGLGLG